MAQLQPLVRYTSPYITGLGLSVASNTTLSIALGEASDSNNLVDIKLAAATTLNAAVNGVNGLDTGTLAASTTYYVYVIGDSRNINPTATLLSLSSTAPYLPAASTSNGQGIGYDSFRRIGSAITDGSTHFLAGYQDGAGSARTWWYGTLQQVLGSTAGTGAYVGQVLTAAVPVTASAANVYTIFAPGAASATLAIRPTGASDTTVQKVTGQVSAVNVTTVTHMPFYPGNTAVSLDFLTDSGSHYTVDVLSYVDQL